MANLSHSDARRLYSWWWDSHNTPKNSKWLLDNVADMDGRVKSMIKLIELDADSFARRAEMYYKNRPELMKLVEEFYRAYRALAERYDHVTGELRHAHKTIAAAFPDHLPFELVEDSPPNPVEKDEGESSQDAVNALKKALTHMEAEKEDILLRYHQCREKLTNVERELNDAQMDSMRLNEKAFRAEIEVQTLNEALIQLESDRITKTSELEKVVSCKEDEAMKLKKQLESSESEVSDLKRAVAHLNEEKEASALQYKHCLETIDKLERLLSSAECEVERLNHLVLIGTSKLKTTEEKCKALAVSNQALQVEADNLVKKIAVKDQELSNKEVELDKLQSCLLDENTCREKVEATLETLQNLQTQSQDDQRAIAAELSNMLCLLEAVEGSKRGLEEELENHSLSGTSFLSLREIRERLEREVTRLVGINTSLQHEISCLKEEIELLNSKKLENIEEVLKKKVVAGRSLSELNVELEMSREKVKALQESCQLFNGEKAILAAEKASLLSQFRATTENMNKLLGQNAVLENSLSAVKVELEGLREKSKGLEEICKMLKNERSFLLSERDTLILKLDNVERKLQSLENKHLQLREKYADLERENEAMHFQVERLEASLGEEKRQRTRMAGFENEIHVLQEENRSKKKESENELEKALKAQFEISILQKFIKDMESKNYSLIAECQKHVEASKLAEKVIKELESDSLEQQVETELLLDEIGRLRLGIYQIFAALEDRSPEEETETDPNLVNRILESVEGMKFAISKNEDEKQHLFVQNSDLEALLKQLESKRVDEMNELGSEMELQKAENSALKDAIFRLEREMHEVRECNAQTKVKLFDAEMQLEATEKMNTALFKTVAELRIDAQRSELVREDLEMEMVRLSETNSTQMKEIHHLHEVQKDLESEVGLLNQEIEEKTVREQTLSIELQGIKNEFEICEAEAASFCFDLQVSSVKEVLLKDKVQELTVVCQSLEHKYAAKTFEFEQMKAQNCVMENEINRLKSKVSGYGPVIASLTDDITLLELKAANSHGTEFLEFLPSEAISQVPSGDATILSLQNLQKRVQVVGKLLDETNKSVIRRRSNAKSKQEGSSKKEQKTKTKTKSFKVRNTIQMKDIPLDQASDGKRGNSCSDDHMLELWETVEDGNRDQMQTTGESRVSHKLKGRSKDYDRFDYMKGKRDQPSTDSDMEKELAVDKLEISSRITERFPELNDKNILEKLASDADKLESLQTTLYGLRKKLEANKKNIKAKNIDFETVKEQLKEAEDSLLHLVDLNVQLVKNIEECPPDDVASPRLKETVKVWRIKVMEQAAKGSEKLDLLLLAVQKIQFFVSKMDDEANKFLKGRTVILRDFIHSGRRNSFRRKQGPRFGCFRQSDS